MYILTENVSMNDNLLPYTAWQELGVASIDDNLLGKLLTCYSEPHRKYHSLEHLKECFAHLKTLRSIAEHPAEIELALWFHDAIYKTTRKDNEERCALWAKESALSNGLPADVADRIYNLIIVTKHTTAPKTQDEKIIVDIDLGILGAPQERFALYEKQVAAEYWWVPWPLYPIMRRNVLKTFLSRKHIYYTNEFHSLYETQARENLTQSLSSYR